MSKPIVVAEKHQKRAIKKYCKACWTGEIRKENALKTVDECLNKECSLWEFRQLIRQT